MSPELIGNVLSWASDVEPDTIEQAAKASRLPFVKGHLALMPDAHIGKGATVGSVIPTRGAIIPAAVGVDIGCGMCAVDTGVTSSALPGDLSALLDRIGQVIPAGVGKGRTKDIPGAGRIELTRNLREAVAFLYMDESLRAIAANQMGSLGSGNHFVEVCLDERDHVWLVLHSGSRGVGNKLAQHHIDIAKGLMKDYFINLEDPDLSYLVEGTAAFDAYIADMLWAQDYAAANREAMMVEALLAFRQTVSPDNLAPAVVERINCFAGETGVITSSGTFPIETLAGGVHELLTTGGEWVKAPVSSFGRQEVMELELSRCGTTKVIRATRGHRWLTLTRAARIEKTTSELRPGDRLEVVFAERPEMSPDRLGCARGFVFGDGSLPRPNGRSVANFCGEKDRFLLSLFEGVGNAPRTYDALIRITGLPGEWKSQYPTLDCPSSYLYGWLAGYFAADGDVDKTGRPSLSSASIENLEFVRAACQVLGIGTFGIRTRPRSGFGAPPSPLHVVGIMRGDLDSGFFLLPHHRARFETGRNAAERRGWNVVDVRVTGEKVEVYCATVEGTHTFALEDNILTGNCHHNFTQRENHHGHNVWLTRKGAISAYKDQRGVIPGSMGTRTYIVRGLGNPASYSSCSHGAGRRLSRGKARKELTTESLREAMGDRTWNADNAEALLDEHPLAYKDIDVVMEDQKDLVEIVHTLHQILNYKGVS